MVLDTLIMKGKFVLSQISRCDLKSLPTGPVKVKKCWFYHLKSVPLFSSFGDDKLEIAPLIR